MGLENVFAIGGLVQLTTNEMLKGLPMLAPVAQQQADLLAGNIQRLLRKQVPKNLV